MQDLVSRSRGTHEAFSYQPPYASAGSEGSATGRHRQHLIRLNRLTALMDRLERTDMEVLYRYESSLEEYIWYKEAMEEDPEAFPPENLGDMPKMPVLEDIKASYYELFPNSNERMRQRDFSALRDVGYEIYYSHKYRRIIFEDPCDD